MNYICVNNLDCVRFISKLNDNEEVFYDLPHYRDDKLIIDMYPEFVNNDLYPKFTNYLKNKGFNVVFKGIIHHNDFGIPTNNKRLIILCSKNSNYKLDVNFFMGDTICSPLSLLYGTPIGSLFTIYKNWCNKLGYDSNIIEDTFDDYLDIYDDVLDDYLVTVVNLYDNPKPHFSDNSNHVPKGKKKKIDNKYRIGLLDKITNDDYYHFNPKRSKCNVREILRLNAYPDYYLYENMDIDGCIKLVSNRLSPYIINKLWGLMY